ncbi:HD-GYP domain-containing protein [Brevibacillus fulvus]|uniref:HD-GYP domain-containing protein (C-di-GMP phosphodiesterase class II) n=1 Tax=Brevibacillus fulvus TaxID=1125967 RepID=A0A939BTD4_9BACL|nr:HD-GYP domain-containing protein [Brevibacillus fulvus]MBM7591707.1 HD-GYP domain-containing protein (c-di-GMP phosphodiesterase class II) [Brevibacillus fulvus]
MRLLSLKQARPGMKVGKTIFTGDGKVLLGNGMILTDRLIDGLVRSGIDAIYIDDPQTEDIVVEDLIRPETRRLAADTIQKTVKQLMNSNKLARRVSVKDMGLHFQQAFQAILSDLMGNPQILVHLANISTFSGSMYYHAVNVSVLATAVGMSLGYNRNQLLDLGIGAMLHDIGKIELPPELLKKETRWTEEEMEIAKQHTIHGFNILRKQHDISLLSAHIALQHHERLDGSGYPQGLSGKKIHEYAQIVAICDIYDSLTSPKPWRKRYMPQDALEYLLGSGGYLFEHRLVQAFRDHIAIFPVGSGVVLNTGETGVVCRVDPKYCQRPTVRVMKDGRGNDVRMPYEVDLKEELTKFIVGFDDDELFHMETT